MQCIARAAQCHTRGYRIDRAASFSGGLYCRGTLCRAEASQFAGSWNYLSSGDRAITKDCEAKRKTNTNQAVFIREGG
jgi:hypothetical protein